MTGQFVLPEDRLAIREMAQRFTADAITPHAAGFVARDLLRP